MVTNDLSTPHISPQICPMFYYRLVVDEVYRYIEIIVQKQRTGRACAVDYQILSAIVRNLECIERTTARDRGEVQLLYVTSPQNKTDVATLNNMETVTRMNWLASDSRCSVYKILTRNAYLWRNSWQISVKRLIRIQYRSHDNFMDLIARGGGRTRCGSSDSVSWTTQQIQRSCMSQKTCQITEVMYLNLQRVCTNNRPRNKGQSLRCCRQDRTMLLLSLSWQNSFIMSAIVLVMTGHRKCWCSPDDHGTLQTILTFFYWEDTCDAL